MQKNNLATNLVSHIQDLIDNNPAINSLKRQSKVLHKKLKEEYKTKGRNDFLSLRQCQDLVAQQHGYKHWHEFHTNIKKLYITKEYVDLITYESPSKIPNLSTNKKPICLGYNKELGLKAWTAQESLLNHMLIEGDTNFRQKIELSLIKQLINEGQHIIYMDGNDSQETTNKIIEYAKNSGREKDIRILSFANFNLDESLKQYQWHLPINLSSSSGGLTEMLYSMLDESIGNTWRGRAISLLSTVLMALVYLRDNEELILDFEVINQYLLFENLYKLKNRKDLPRHIKDALQTYFSNLPGFIEGSVKQQHDYVLEKHGYLQMQFIRILHTLLSYKHLFYHYGGVEESRLKLQELYGGQKSFIFIVQFPDFSKTSQEMDILSKFIFGSILNNAVTNLGATIEGSTEQRIKQKQLFKERTNSAIFVNNCYVSQNSAILRQLSALNTSLIFSYANKENNPFIIDKVLTKNSFKLKEHKIENDKILFNLYIDYYNKILQINE